MIVVLKREATEKQIEEMIEFLEKTGIQVHRFTGTSTTVLGLIGDTSTISSDDIEKKQIVESVKKVQTPYKRVSVKICLPSSLVFGISFTSIK